MIDYHALHAELLKPEYAGLLDSDSPEQTPHTKAMEVVMRRRERIKRTEDEQG